MTNQKTYPIYFEIEQESYLNINSNVSSQKFIEKEIKPENWDKVFPYELLILKAVTEDGKTSYKKYRSFTLPFPPQEISIEMPMATVVYPTLDEGIVEQMGGVPFQNITLNGTTGANPQKGNYDAANPNAVFVKLAPNMARAFEDIKAKTSKIVNDINVLGEAKRDNEIQKDNKTSGFYVFMQMEKFIRQYHYLKTSTTDSVKKELSGVDPKDLRLAFVNGKEDSIFLVTGVSLTKKKTSISPLEYNYTLNLKAWARVEVDSYSPSAWKLDDPLKDPYYIEKAIRIYNLALDALNAYGALPQTAIGSLASDAKRIIRQAKALTEALTGTAANLVNARADAEDAYTDLRDQAKGLYSKGSKLTNAIDRYKGRFGKVNQIGINQPSYGQNSNSFSNNSPEINAATRDINDETKKELQTAQSNTPEDWKRNADTLQALSDGIAKNSGKVPDIYDQTFGLPSTPPIKSQLSESETNLLYLLDESKKRLQALAAKKDPTSSSVRSLNYIAGFAERSGIAFQIPVSKFLIPFPYGATLPGLAAQYLGDANRWMEIAALNGLRYPYIDEVGFNLALQTNAEESSVIVNSVEDLYLGQPVSIVSNGQKRVFTKINYIKKLEDNSYLVILAATGLTNFKVEDSARLEAFLPGTTNSTKSIYIPSQETPIEDPRLKEIPGIDYSDNLLAVGGVDLLLDDSLDLVFDEGGDIKPATALNNMIQQLKILFSMRKGQNQQHPELGLSIYAGQSLADFDQETLKEEIKKMVEADPSFESVKNIQTSLDTNRLLISMEIKVRNNIGNIPITFGIEV